MKTKTETNANSIHEVHFEIKVQLGAYHGSDFFRRFGLLVTGIKDDVI